MGCAHVGYAHVRRTDVSFLYPANNSVIIHHRLSTIIVQLGKVVPNCTRYTSSHKISGPKPTDRLENKKN